MIIIYHNQSKITEVVAAKPIDFSKEINRCMVAALLDFAQRFNDEILVWCHESEKDNLNVAAIQTLFHHKKLLFSYHPSSDNYFGNELGYIEDSPYINVPKAAKYPTWQMSSHVGAIHASVLKACKKDLNEKDAFDYFLNSLARRAMSFGLFCYSEPQLLLNSIKSKPANKSNLYELFKFTKQHYRARWILLLFLNLLLFEKRFPLLPFLAAIFYKKRNFNSKPLDAISLQSNKKIIDKGTMDVLIPTIGRKTYLFDVLKNLASQTHLPVNVIIVEQNPEESSKTELDFIQTEPWPFKIKHHFTHQSGVCNARNIGLKLIESEFTFFADDDLVFENNLLEKAMEAFQTTGNEVFLIACHLKTQKIEAQLPKQFPVFGAGHAFVKSSCLAGISFNMGFEFGFGEDADFGMQLRCKGFDVLYISTSTILHLKAPMGGFRTKPVLRWQTDEILPKPSPTVMLYRLFYDTKEQLLSYKITLFFKNLDKSFFRNPIKYLKVFRQKWDRSIFWANELSKK
ncbi:glycosyltransferase family 2 protein [Flavobacterium sp.]|uniref:glycosyltransferase family 2 protein n=1 Tax=Flavobacterium sp. TaxID=239 RepID=UPI002FD901A7